MTSAERKRKPRVFAADDPALDDMDRDRGLAAPDVGADPEAAPAASPPAAPPKGFAWGSLLVGSLTGLLLIAAGVSFAQFVSLALARSDWVGWTAFILLMLAGTAALVLLLRELVGLLRLSRLVHLRRAAEAALRERSLTAERAVIRDLKGILLARPQLAWPLARFREHEAGVHDPGDLLVLADRELIAPLDLEARRIVLASARRVSVVTAISPMVLIAVAYVLVENVRMLRATAALYGGRPGLIGALRLARMVTAHLLATGGVALTDDLFGQFLGQDLLRRLSRRLGEGVFNGALTARIGTVAIEVCRPLPFIEAAPVRLRDFLGELVRRRHVGSDRTSASPHA
ncbi:MAG TPA: TIGR01620 family protein [Hyphomicrobiaceae bacterium]|nr:TIGR01620 family protein [Hyphomicrobiaceae bacterium]